MSSERRLFSRIDFQSSVKIQFHSLELQADLVDISLKGALISFDTTPAMKKGNQCFFELQLDQASAAVRMEATIVYAKKKLLGLRFDHPDLESITHLRRLIELNTGDSMLVQKELFFLAGSSPED